MEFPQNELFLIRNDKFLLSNNLRQMFMVNENPETMHLKFFKNFCMYKLNVHKSHMPFKTPFLHCNAF